MGINDDGFEPEMVSSTASALSEIWMSEKAVNSLWIMIVLYCKQFMLSNPLFNNVSKEYPLSPGPIVKAHLVTRR